MTYSHRLTVKKATENQEHELYPASSFRTFIGAGAKGLAKKDSGIHKKWEVVQERASDNGLSRTGTHEQMHPGTAKHTSIV